MLDGLVSLVTRVRPDYLKWDNNFRINCDRDGHGATDGNFAHVRELYRLLAELRRQFPGLLIENARTTSACAISSATDTRRS